MKTLLSRVLIPVIALVVLLVAVYLLAGPITALVAQGSLTGLSPADKAAALAATRSAVTASAGVVGAIVAAVLAIPKFFAERDKQRIDRFSAAVGHLLEHSMTGRIAGVWELDQIMDSSPRDREGARYVLAQFIREFSPREATTDQSQRERTELPGDIAIAVAVASKPRRRVPGRPTVPLDLRDTNLAGAQLADANFEQARMRGANLTKADLARSVLVRADLTGSILTEASLPGARCHQATLANAQLTRADLTGADLSQAALANADLTGASLEDADMTGADLHRARLEGVDLAKVRGLTTTQLTSARLDASTRLPVGIDHPVNQQRP